MAEKPNDFNRFAESIRATATNVGALIVEALLDSNEQAAPQVQLGLDEMLAAIRHVRPRLIYLDEACFELETEAFDSSEAEEGDGVEFENHDHHPALEELTRKWRKHDGKPCFAFASFVTEGVLHKSVECPDWHEDFVNELEKIKEEIESEFEDERESLSKRDSQEVRE